MSPAQNEPPADIAYYEGDSMKEYPAPEPSICEYLAVNLFGWEEDGYYVEWCKESYFVDWKKDGNLPQWDSTWHGAGEVIEAMRKKGISCIITIYPNRNDCQFFTDKTEYSCCHGPTPTQAIAKAAVAALEAR